ncbi:MAG: hypothetical protein JNM48_06930 [Rhodospirillales bacterium]|nr:hypothetical protein [Rhodospirillales bacterium]
MRLPAFAVVLLLLGGPVASWSPGAAAAEESRLPVPRFVSLRVSEAIMRAGPGQEYPIRWTYQHVGIPLEVTRDYYDWRRVRDWQGSEGWMHSRVLSSRRTVMISGEIRTLRDEPEADATPVARLQGPVIGKLLSCPKNSDWCRIEVSAVKGWLRRSEMWGVYPKEEVE